MIDFVDHFDLLWRKLCQGRSVQVVSMDIVFSFRRWNVRKPREIRVFLDDVVSICASAGEAGPSFCRWPGG